jgi:cyclophilin family peptidyl-prolyl cis-trans isomerase
MATERSSSLELSGLEDAFEWIKARKNLIVGTVLVVLLALAISAFVRRQVHESAVQPWRSLFTAAGAPWSTPSAELAAVATTPDADADVQAYGLYWQALQRLDEGNAAGALELLEQFRSRFPNHLLVTSRISLAGQAPTSPVDRTIARVKRLQEWNAAHPAPTANPPPAADRKVTLVTERGSIVLGLYPEQSPKSVEAFLKLAPALKDRFIAKASPDRWVEVGQDVSGVAVEATGVEAPFPPHEPSQLSHFSGAVSFRQAPFGKAPFNADLRVMLANDFAEDGRSTVFAHVVEGLEVLKTLSNSERKSDAPQMLASPLKITDVQLQ